jgi:hypothetical protein
MTKDDMVQRFTDMIDDAFEAGWNEGYLRGYDHWREYND